ncbi:SDR family oxidoreductase [Paenibacillus koleovorans]|uniref:SDR family oxidoreductase n=1 Tax=Paenibacillus koleovorans TaxID=121608 RepID=UPI000FD812BB|nr:SDR family NAD(P)-dependent oxidoreductase [Paenibacillus koleovorans]
MKLSGNKILITGGTSGIGLAFALRLLQLGNQILVVARDPAKLNKLKADHPGIEIFAADVSKDDSRQSLTDWIRREHPDLNVLINNAGIQYQDRFLEGEATEAHIRDEIEINFLAPIDLCSKLLPILANRPSSAIVNVTSGLGLVPKRSAPVYCGTKAGLHLFSKALRYQLEGTPVKVFEILPPLVETNMTVGRGINKITPDQVVDEFLRAFVKDRFEVPVAKVKLLRVIQRIAPSLADRILKNS